MSRRFLLSVRASAALVLLGAASACREAPSAPEVPPGNLLGSTTSLDVFILADSRLTDAETAIIKAMILIGAAENPASKNPDKPFGGHDEKAIAHLAKAREAIAAAKAYADGSTTW